MYVHDRLVDLVDVVEPRGLDLLPDLRIREARHEETVTLLDLVADTLQVRDDELEAAIDPLTARQLDHGCPQQFSFLLGVERVSEQGLKPTCCAYQGRREIRLPEPDRHDHALGADEHELALKLDHIGSGLLELRGDGQHCTIGEE